MTQEESEVLFIQLMLRAEKDSERMEIIQSLKRMEKEMDRRGMAEELHVASVNWGSILQKGPPPGTPLRCALAIGWPKIFSHSGIYLGKGTVAELNGDGDMVAVSLSEFLNGNIGAWSPTLYRTGFHIFAACDAASGTPLGSAKVAKAAREKIQMLKKQEYHLFSTNCHWFTASCIGSPFVKTEDSQWLDGQWMIDRLECVIEQFLNKGRKMEWLAVSSETPGFRYEATLGKRVQRELFDNTTKCGAFGVGVAVGVEVIKAALDIWVNRTANIG